MIRINLLPPELRKRQRSTAINPSVFGLLVGILVSLAAAGFWGYVQYVRIPHAEEQVAQREKQFKKVKRQADEVRELETEVQSFLARVRSLRELIDRKVRWAGTLSDFADLLGRDYWVDETGERVPGLQVSCLGLSVSQTRARSGGRRNRGDADDSVRFRFQWEMEMVGLDFNLAGDYQKAFFENVGDSDFWYDNGFVETPTEPYKGDRPVVDEDIERVVITYGLLWERDQHLQIANRKALAAAGGEGDG